MKRLSFGLGILLLLLASIASAQPYAFEFYTFSSDFSTSYPVLHNGNPVPVGMMVQVIRPGANAALDPPVTAGANLGNVSNDDQLATSFPIGAGGDATTIGMWDAFLTGFAGAPVGAQLQTGTQFYIRVWLDIPDGSSFPFPSGSMYCDGGPYTVPTAALANNPDGIHDVQVLPNSTNPNWQPAGSALAPVLAVTIGGNPPANPVDYGSVTMPASGDMVFHLANTGNADLHVSSLAATGDYAVQGLTGYTITAGNAQDVTVRFTPSATGTRTGTFSFTNDGPGPLYTANLTGNGLPALVSNLVVTIGGNPPPNPVDYGTVQIGNTGDMVFHLANTGGAVLNTSNFSASGDYSIIGATPTTIAAGNFADVTVRFTPSATGVRNGTFSFNENGPGPSYSASLIGMGSAAPAPNLAVTIGGNSVPNPVDYGSVTLGNGADMVFHIANTGTAMLHVTNIGATGDFSALGLNSYNISPATAVDVTVHFAPSALGVRNGTFSFNNDGPGPLYSASLIGMGSAVAAPGLQVMQGVNAVGDNSSYSFPDSTAVGSSSTVMYTITNTGNADLTVGNFAIAAPFSTTTPVSPVTAGNFVNVTITFTPTTVGTFNHDFTFTNNVGGTFTIHVSGISKAYHHNTTNPSPGSPWTDPFPGDPNTGGLPPLVLNFDAGAGQPTSVDLVVDPSRFPGMPNLGDNNHLISRFWDIMQTGGVNFNCTVDFYFGPADLPAGIPDPTAVPMYAHAYNTVTFTWTTYPVVVTVFQAVPLIWQGEITGVTGFSQWELNDQLPTPVTAMHVNATAGDHSVALNWTTETEINNAYFQIQRRNVTANGTFADMARNVSLAPNGNSATRINYHFTDNTAENGVTYQYRIADVSQDGVTTNGAVVSATPRAPIIQNFSLTNYPNPFNPETRISYTMKTAGNVKITINDVMGRTIATLVNENASVGNHTISWNASNMPSGLYFLNMETNGFSTMRKMVLSK